MTDEELILVNSNLPKRLREWMDKNDYRRYGLIPGENWVSWSKTGTDARVLSTQEIVDAFLKEQGKKPSNP